MIFPRTLRLLIVLLAVALPPVLSNATVNDAPVDPYARLLAARVDAAGLVDYKALAADRSDLDAAVRAVSAVDPTVYRAWTDDARIAFLINAYNVLTLALIVDHYPLTALPRRMPVYPADSIQQIDRPWDEKRFTLLGVSMSLNEIEHGLLRAQFDVPEVHAALVCAAMGCPRLRRDPYNADGLRRQLAEQSRRYVQSPYGLKIDRDAGVVYLSSIFRWYGSDFVNQYGGDDSFAAFTKNAAAVLNFVAQHATDADAATLRAGGYEVRYLPYDWSLNRQP